MHKPTESTELAENVNNQGRQGRHFLNISVSYTMSVIHQDAAISLCKIGQKEYQEVRFLFFPAHLVALAMTSYAVLS